MTASTELVTLISDHGLAILAPLAILEGPMVTVIASYLASLQLMDLGDVILCVILADLIGDCLLYAVGRGILRGLPGAWRPRPMISARRLVRLAAAYRHNGVRLLVIGKLTHAAGFAALIAAGAARMPFALFVVINLAAGIPKSLAFVAIGYLFGAAHGAISTWLSFGSALILGVLLCVAAFAIVIHKRRLA